MFFSCVSLVLFWQDRYFEERNSDEIHEMSNIAVCTSSRVRQRVLRKQPRVRRRVNHVNDERDSSRLLYGAAGVPNAPYTQVLHWSIFGESGVEGMHAERPNVSKRNNSKDIWGRGKVRGL